MSSSFDQWYDSFVSEMESNLAKFHPRNDKTGSNERWRRFYVTDARGKEHFVAHMRPVPTKSRANIMLGLDERFLNVPDGCPPLELRDKSVPQYREFNVDMNTGPAKTHAINLAVQVAEHFA